MKTWLSQRSRIWPHLHTYIHTVHTYIHTYIHHRLTSWAESNDILADEQNGFRQGRSCPDHLSVLSEIIQTREQQKKSTFVAYIDFSQAFDRINRVFLWQKLTKMGLEGKILQAIKSLYENVESNVRINGHMSDFFNVISGLKQGCLLSPRLFSLFINDM